MNACVLAAGGRRLDEVRPSKPDFTPPQRADSVRVHNRLEPGLQAEECGSLDGDELSITRTDPIRGFRLLESKILSLNDLMSRFSPTFFALLLASQVAGFSRDLNSAPPFTIDLTVARSGFDTSTCWVHARSGIIPGGGESGDPLVIMTLQKLQLTGSDVFFGLNQMQSPDGGTSWTDPMKLAPFSRRPFSFDGRDNLEITVCDFSPKWHQQSGKLLGTGQTVVYEKNRVMGVRPRETAYSVYDTETRSWSPWNTIKLPAASRFGSAGAGSVQRYDLPDGDVLLPIYFKEIGATRYSTTVLLCSFDGETLRYTDHGSELSVPVKRGLYEPSITKHDGRFFLTMRNDDSGYVSRSDDPGGLVYPEPKRWTFDDGSSLGNYNTQQHWVTHPKHGLFLVYTRRGAGNDHVFRHRAPLFIAQVDPERLHVIRATEQILVPEKGARLGNFGVTEFSKEETWVTVTEWMQGKGPNHGDPEPLVARGADNRLWIAKLKWTE